MAPPRGRKKQPLRIDAALAAMRPMGFPDKVVRKCVTKLLKVYGKDSEGWYFIEEASYKLLIETLIDGDGESEPLPAITGGKGEGSSKGEPSSLPLLCSKETADDENAGKHDDEDATNGKVIVSLSEINVKCEAEENASQDYSVPALLKPPHFEPLPIKKVPAITRGNGEGSSKGEPSSLPLLCSKEAVGDETAGKDDDEDSTNGKAIVSLSEIYVKCEAEEITSQDYSVPALLKPPHFEPLPTNKVRKPCYGWISDDNDDDDDDNDKFLLLPPPNEKSPFKP